MTNIGIFHKKAIYLHNEHLMNMIQATGLLTDLHGYFQSEPRILHAWLFGSFARNNAHENSDIDVMVEMKVDKPYTLFDLFDIQHRLEKLRFVAFCAQMGLKVMVSSEQYNNDNNKTRQWKNYVVTNGQLIKSDCK